MGGVEFTQSGCGIVLKKEFGAYVTSTEAHFYTLKEKPEKD
jgi:hypothetical protein